MSDPCHSPRSSPAHLVPQPHDASSISSPPLSNIVRCLLLHIQVILRCPYVTAVKSTPAPVIMAFDWTFPLAPPFPSESFGTRNIDFSEAGLFDSFEVSAEDNPAPHLPLQPGSETWPGLECTCHLISAGITCWLHPWANGCGDPSMTIPDHEYMLNAADQIDCDIAASPRRVVDTVPNINACANPCPPIVHQSPSLRPKRRRAVISTRHKRTLENQLAVNAYPSNVDVNSLSKLTGLSLKTVGTWFGNARSRKLRSRCKSLSFDGHPTLTASRITMSLFPANFGI